MRKRENNDKQAKLDYNLIDLQIRKEGIEPVENITTRSAAKV
jgi:hypothetical protein